MKVIPQVSELRRSGLKVKVNHLRDFYRFDPKTGRKSVIRMSFHEKTASFPDYYLEARGGTTIISIIHPDFKKPLVGVAECSQYDIFNKKFGTKKALAIALAPVFEEKENSGN